MRKLMAAVAVLALVSGAARPDDAAKGGGQPPAAKAQKGPEHKILERYVGKFTVTGTVYHRDPKEAPLKFTGTSEAEFLGGSSWVVSRGKARGSMEMEDAGILCYDAKKGKYTAVGANSVFPPGLDIGEGTYDAAKRTMSWKEQKTPDPITGEEVIVKGEDVFQDDGTIVSTSYIKRPGTNEFVKWAEFVSKRR